MFEGYGRGRGDVVLESRHLIGLFLLFVVISGLFFTLGWVMRGSQQDAVVAATGSTGETAGDSSAVSATGSASSAPGASGGSKALSDLDYYRTGEPKKMEPPLEKAGKGVSGATKTLERKASPSLPAATKSSPSKPGSLLSAPLIPRGAVVLQVAAMKNLGDGLALAGALQEKGFPAFVIPPTTDFYYRVQVGPYADSQSANQARRDLERQGFKSIIKR